MKAYSVLSWVFILLAAIFLFFSLRTQSDQILYSLIALGLWGVAYLLNKYKPGENKKKT